MPYSRPFDEPIPTDGKEILTLQDAADYIMKLPKAEHDKEHWQEAGKAVIMAAEERGPILHAEIGMRRALNFGKVKPERVRSKRVRKYRVIK